ncbi:DNA cytosine methyltransferase [Klebsiella variicola]|uniref:DNA cytosine methyltransferase n=1 Tax=Klebsiella variicola TaxID=244366 RepID=UPI0035A21D02|nr:DNA cytosine methyltransferase [Klebsiella variicola subsp. variicola]
MTPSAYYNEIDPFAAQWLRNLIAAGHIAPGEVDERSIEDVTPDDLRGFTQCHFFAGIGVWSHSLHLAGWPDDKPVWTGSCPCQPFSAAGKGDGFADERHLWPHFFHLISERRPQHVFGEQVASGNANTWFDLVQADLEGVGYAFGLVPFTSAGIGAPHQRDRAYWVADASCEQWEGRGEFQPTGWGKPSNSSVISELADANYHRQQSSCGCGSCGQCTEAGNYAGRCCQISNMADADSNGREGRLSGRTDAEREAIDRPAGRGCTARGAGPVNGFWRDADWLLCRDGKWRPVEPGTFPLVDGAAARMGRVEPGVARVASSNRVGRLKGYGNAINALAAAAFIRAYMGVQDGQ